MYHKRDFPPRLNSALQSNQIKHFASIKSKCGRIHPFMKLARQHTHTDEITAVYTLKTLRYYCLYTQQPSALRRPIPRTAGAIFMARNHNQWHPLLLVLHGSIVDAHAFAIRIMSSYSAL